MRKIIIFTLLILFILPLTSCADTKLSYDFNLGYDLSEINYQTIEFNIYHSNSDNHQWERLKTFSYVIEDKNFIDVRIEGSKNKIIIICEDNTVETTNESAYYFTNDLDSFEYEIDGFEGIISAHRSFEIKNNDQEQMFRLYPINNCQEGIFEHSVTLNSPYDSDEENLDNILISIKFHN